MCFDETTMVYAIKCLYGCKLLCKLQEIERLLASAIVWITSLVLAEIRT
jgi:hypothetical protein